MIRDSLLYLLAGLAARAAGFVMIPFYSSHLSPAQYGIIELIELATQVVSLAIGLNMFGSALIRIFQSAVNRKEENAVTSTAVLTGLALNTAGVLIALLLAPLISRGLFPAANAIGLLQLTMVSMLFGNAADLCLCYVRLKERAAFFVVYSVLALVATIGLNVYFIGYRGAGVLGFVESKLIVTGIGALVLVTMTLRETRIHWDFEAARSMARFGAPLIVANVAFFALHFGDRFFLSRFNSLTEVGNYSLAYKCGFLITFLVAEPFGRAWNVRYIAMMRTPGWQQQFRSVSRFFAGALVAAALAIALFSDELLPYFVTPPYFPAARVIPLIAAAYVLREMGDFFRNMLYINLRSPLVSAISVGAAGLNFLLNWLWIPPFGMMGAAWATFTTWAVYALVLYVAAEKDLAVGFPRWAYLGFFASGAAWFAAGLRARFPLPLLELAADMALLAAFLLFVWKSGLLSIVERKLALEKVQMGREVLGRRWEALRRV